MLEAFKDIVSDISIIGSHRVAGKLPLPMLAFQIVFLRGMAAGLVIPLRMDM